VTFVLTTGGHNVGIVSMPSKTTKRQYRISTLKENDRFVDADSWYQATKPRPGSWWPALEKWLAKHSQHKLIHPPLMGNPEKGIIPLENAPGTYVLQK
jgi:polyhydroxyalkanoate synthase